MTIRRTMLGISLAALLTVAMPAAQKRDAAESALRTAMDKETIDGDLKAAAAMYRRIITTHKDNRAVVAKALVRLAECAERLGEAEARQYYERIIRDFSDQKDAVATARVRLAALGSGTAGRTMTARLLWDDGGGITGTISADGRFVSYTDWSTAGQVGIRDLITGENRVLSGPGKNTGPLGWATGSALSADGSRVAFSYETYVKNRSEQERVRLHVIGVDGSGHQILLDDEAIDYVEPRSWSPDGKWIAVAANYKAAGSVAMLVSAEGGRPRTLSTGDQLWRSPILFSPDGKWLAYGKRTAPTGQAQNLCVIPADGTTAEEKTLEENARLMGWTPDGAGIVFQRERAGSAVLYLLPVTRGQRAGEPQLINGASNIGRAMGISSEGMMVTGTYNRTGDGMVYPWDGDPSHLTKPLFTFPVSPDVGLALGGGLMRFSPDGKKMLAVVLNGGVLIRELGTTAERVVTPQIREIQRVEWTHDSRSLLVGGVGFDGKPGLFRVDEATGKADRVADERLAGFFEPSRDGRTIFYWVPNEGKVYAHDLTTRQDKLLVDNTPQGNWHMEESHDGNSLAVKGADGIVVVDLSTGQVREIYKRPDGSHEAIWALQWSPDDRELMTIFRVGGGMERMDYVTFPAGGGAPTRRPIDNRLRGLAISPDGKLLATTRTHQRTQIWGLENFLPDRRVLRK